MTKLRNVLDLASGKAHLSAERQQRLQKILRIESLQQVILYTGYITALATASSVLVVGLATFWIHWMAFIFAVSIATAIPLLIAPPLGFFVLYMLWMITQAVDQVNDHIRFDPLTRALTRGYFMDMVQRMFQQGGAFLIVDADHFKSINDSYGHDVGDDTLKSLAAAIGASAEPGWVFGRLGGEEFGLFIPHADLRTAAAACERICQAVRTRGRQIAGKRIDLTVSIGCALRSPGLSLGEVMKTADMRLYDAKRGGRNRYVIDGLSAEMVRGNVASFADPARNMATLVPV